MKKREIVFRFVSILFAVALVMSFVAIPAKSGVIAGDADPVINEFVFNHTGTDTHEFVEIFGAPSTGYESLTIVEIEGDGSGAGLIDDGVFAVGTTDAAGYWTTGFQENVFENGTVTILLVKNFTGNVDDDLDTDNDCVLDVTPWDAVVDGIGVNDGGSSDCNYSDTVLNKNFDGVPYTPGGASRIPNGTDTNAVADWMRNDYDGAGLPGFTGSPVEGEAYNTPGEENSEVIAAPDVCGDPYTPIYEIQGNGSSSPLEGEVVSTEGVVTGDFQGSDQLRGFFVQDPVGDGDPATSDGIFVYYNDVDVAVGDTVRINKATVKEYYGQTQLSYTSELLICDVGAEVAATPVSLPVADVGDWEPFEGMLITFPQPLYASDLYSLHRYGEVPVSADSRQFASTNFMDPGPAAGDSNHNNIADVNEPGRILLDDGSTAQFPDVVPYIAGDGTLRAGDTVTNLTGNLGYGYGQYRVQPTTPTVLFERVNHRSATPGDVGSGPGVIKVATFNLWNYWTTIDDGENGARGADSEVEFERQQAKLVPAILGLDADVIGVEELENNGDVAVANLVDALNEATAPGTWAFVPEPPGIAGTNAIKVGIIYQPARVTPVGDSMADDDPIYDRPPVAQTFDANGEIFTVVVNHFKSKGCYDVEGPNEDQGDGQGCYNYKRTQQAQALLAYVDELKAVSGDNDVVVLGDFNSYAKEDPITTLNAGLVNPTDTYLESDDSYSYVYYGQAGQLDYIFTDEAMADRITGLDIWHINADEPRVLDYNDEIIDPGERDSDYSQDYLYVPDQYRSSDHDPVLMGFCEAVPPELQVSVTPEDLGMPRHDYKPVATTVTVADNADPNVTVELVSVISNEPDWTGRPRDLPYDIIIVDDYNFWLRAEYDPTGNGRVYTITYRATDACGNSTLVSVNVTAGPWLTSGYLDEVLLTGNVRVFLPMALK